MFRREEVKQKWSLRARLLTFTYYFKCYCFPSILIDLGHQFKSSWQHAILAKVTVWTIDPFGKHSAKRIIKDRVFEAELQNEVSHISIYVKSFHNLFSWELGRYLITSILAAQQRDFLRGRLDVLPLKVVRKNLPKSSFAQKPVNVTWMLLTIMHKLLHFPFTSVIK